MHESSEQWLTQLEVLLSHSTGEFCLEIGCGTENLKELAEKKGYIWIGLDRHRWPGLTIVGDVHHLPFRNDCINAALCFKVLEHLPNPFQALTNISRVLKKESYLIGSVAFLEPFHNSYYHFTHLGVRTALQQAGFEICDISSGWNFFESMSVMIMMAHPDSNVGVILRFPMRACFKIVLWLRKKFTSFYCKYFDSSGDRIDLKSVFKEDDLRYAGEIKFAAILRRK